MCGCHLSLNPQRFVRGREFTSFAVLRDGALRALTTAQSSASQLNYEHVDVESIAQWWEYHRWLGNIILDRDV